LPIFTSPPKTHRIVLSHDLQATDGKGVVSTEPTEMVDKKVFYSWESNEEKDAVEVDRGMALIFHWGRSTLAEKFRVVFGKLHLNSKSFDLNEDVDISNVIKKGNYRN
jgi:hypothetical protein